MPVSTPWPWGTTRQKKRIRGQQRHGRGHGTVMPHPRGSARAGRAVDERADDDQRDGRVRAAPAPGRAHPGCPAATAWSPRRWPRRARRGRGRRRAGRSSAHESELAHEARVPRRFARPRRRGTPPNPAAARRGPRSGSTARRSAAGTPRARPARGARSVDAATPFGIMKPPHASKIRSSPSLRNVTASGNTGDGASAMMPSNRTAPPRTSACTSGTPAITAST